MTKQIEQPNRTMTTAADAVMEFIKTRLASEDPTFTAEQLRFYVTNSVIGRISPGSADRILRQLRQSGKADYYILNRAKSLYKALPLKC